MIADAIMRFLTAFGVLAYGQGATRHTKKDKESTRPLVQPSGLGIADYFFVLKSSIS